MSKLEYPVGITKMDDYIGKTVYLKADVENKGSEKFAAGEPLVVTGHHRGRLSLRRPIDVGQHNRPSLSQIRRYTVTLEPPKKDDRAIA